MYSQKVIEHFTKPRNMGEIEDADAIGKVGNPVCGDIMHIYIKVRDNVITDVGFKTMGCAAAIATSSMITELAKGKPLDDAMKITRNDVADALDGLPPIKLHCSNLAADGLHKAIENYRKGSREGETREEVVGQFSGLKSVTPELAGRLYDYGIISMDELRRLSSGELTRIPGVDEEKAGEIKKEVGFSP
jgi:nitrogen fixation NifU-like protein